MKNLLILFTLLLFAQLSYSQNELPPPGDTSRVAITLENGAVYSGKVVDQNETEVMLVNDDQVFTLPRSEIQNIQLNPDIRKVVVTLKNGTQRKGTLIKESDDEVVLKNENGQLFLDMGQIETIETDHEKEFVKIIMKDGTVYEGYRRKDKLEPHVVYTNSGKIMYDTKQVADIKIIDRSKIGYFDHPYSTRYFFTPTAIPMRKGKGYYSNQYILLNSYHYGLSDNVSIGGGFEFITTLFALTPTPFAHVKVSFSASDNFHYGGGLFTGAILGQAFDEYYYYALPYGMITVGNENKNLTFGGGAGSVAGETISYLSLSGSIRVNRRLGFVSSNYLVFDNFEGDSGFVGIQGIRIMGKSISLDLALAFTPGSIDAGVIIPFIGFGIKI